MCHIIDLNMLLYVAMLSVPCIAFYCPLHFIELNFGFGFIYLIKDLVYFFFNCVANNVSISPYYKTYAIGYWTP